MIFLILAGSVVSAILYRMYGCDDIAFEKEYGWTGVVGKVIRKIPKFRALLCNILALAVASIFVVAPWWMYLICLVLGFLTLLTYHDTKPWNWMNPEDNFWLHGFCNGLALLPLAFFTPSLLFPLALRALTMGLFMGIWCHVLFDIDYIEEWGRGAIIILSLAFLL